MSVRAHERGHSDTQYCQNFSSDTRHWGQKMLDTRHSKFTQTLDTQLQKDVFQIICNIFWTLEINCHCNMVAAQYCFLVKKIWLCCRILNLQDCPKRISPARSVYKASANKNASLVFAFQTPQHFTHFGWTFAVNFFSGVYHPQDVRDEKVSLTLAHWKHGEIPSCFPCSQCARAKLTFPSRMSWGW